MKIIILSLLLSSSTYANLKDKPENYDQCKHKPIKVGWCYKSECFDRDTRIDLLAQEICGVTSDTTDKEFNDLIPCIDSEKAKNKDLTMCELGNQLDNTYWSY